MGKKKKEAKRKGKKPKKKKTLSKKWERYTIKEGKIVRKNKSCPKCGPGVFLAQHGNRISCGKCKYTEFIK